MFGNHIDYNFYHPIHRKKIQMLMFYKDMISWKFESSTFTFRVGRPLECFTVDYNADDPKHTLCVKFDNSVDVDKFAAQVIPCVAKLSNRTSGM